MPVVWMEAEVMMFWIMMYVMTAVAVMTWNWFWYESLKADYSESGDHRVGVAMMGRLRAVRGSWAWPWMLCRVIGREVGR